MRQLFYSLSRVIRVCAYNTNDPTLQGALHEQRKKGGDAPKNLIIYRDGVSEGEYATVVNKEIALIRGKYVRSFTQLALTMYNFLSDVIVNNFPKWRPNLLFIIVTKRSVLSYAN